MSAGTAFLVRTFKVGRFNCTLTFPHPDRGEVVSMIAEWVPHVPVHLSKAEAAAYRAGRNAVVDEYAAMVGKTVAVVG